MVPARYMARIADGVLAEALAVSGAVQVKGPKWCGKTATSLQQAASIVYLQDPDRSVSYLALADAKPSALLEGRTPRLIDEWQMAPQLWDAVRFAVDIRGEPGQFILTGSPNPPLGGARSGAAADPAAARRRGIRTPEHFAGIVAGEAVDTETLAAVVRGAVGGVTEVMMHPGTDNAALIPACLWDHDFEAELAALCAPAVQDVCRTAGAGPVNFRIYAAANEGAR